MRITVFTPTYNRAYIIEKLYRSLQRQTFEDFEWLVVDDGSNDDTEKLFSEWQKEENKFPIRFYKQENKGKCQAINTALDLAEGLLFFTVDSDDYLTDDALQKISDWEGELPKDKPFCGLAANSGTGENETSNPIFTEKFLDVSPLERYNRLKGERAMVFYTEIHKKYKYPYFEGEKFMTEAVVWNRFANDGYIMRFFNDIIWIYEYQEEGLTKTGNSIFVNNPQGYGLCLKEKAQFTKMSFWNKLKMYYTFTCDLSDKYKTDFIAKCIGTNKFIIKACLFVHKLKNKIKK